MQGRCLFSLPFCFCTSLIRATVTVPDFGGQYGFVETFAGTRGRQSFKTKGPAEPAHLFLEIMD
jgi:hypothetical protein